MVIYLRDAPLGHHGARHLAGVLIAFTVPVIRSKAAGVTDGHCLESLGDDLRWVDVAGVAVLAGIGFTVSLLIGELAFGAGSDRDEHVKVGVLVGSLLAALIAALVLRLRNRTYRRICAEEERDSDTDGTPDVYETTAS